jgi:hypothetical protein
MRYIVFITSTAIRDLEAAVDYYDGKAENLGSRFATWLMIILSELLQRLKPLQFAIRIYDVNQ